MSERRLACPHCGAANRRVDRICSACGRSMVIEVTLDDLDDRVAPPPTAPPAVPRAGGWPTGRGTGTGQPQSMTALWVVGAVVAVAVACVLVGAVMSPSGPQVAPPEEPSAPTASQPAAPASSGGEAPAPGAGPGPAPRSESTLEVETWDWSRDDYGSRYLVGTVINNSSHEFAYVQIEFNLYDRSGTQVSSTFDNVNNLEAGGRWRFRALVMEDNATTAKLKGVRGSEQ